MATEEAADEVLGLPAPSDAKPEPAPSEKLDLGNGKVVQLDALGPVILNVDGTMSRITNWPGMSEGEKRTAFRSAVFLHFCLLEC